MIITINTDHAELGEIFDDIAKRTAALLQPQLAGIRQEIATMSGTLEAQLQAAQAATSAALGAIAADLTALAGRLVAGATITDADVAMAQGIAQAAVAAQAQADAMASPPTP